MAHTSSSIQLTKIFQIAQDERNSQIAQIIQNAWIAHSSNSDGSGQYD